METKRPLLVTIICILGFIGIPLKLLISLFNIIPGVADIVGQYLPLWYSMLSIIFSFVYLAGLIYIWKMKKIGVIIYTGLAVVEYGILFILTGIATLMMAVISGSIIAFLWTQYKKMS